jgi:phosphoribosylamine--glycine ligase
MNVLVIGSGGREHAICDAFRRSSRTTRLFCANGNAGIASIAECAPIRPDDVQALADFAIANRIDLTFVGGEIALALGIVDEFERRGLRIIGPRREAAELESSKAFAKDFMARYEVPTAKYAVAHSAGFAVLMLESGDFGNESTPVVIKADGLAAGKGVVVARNRPEAIAACNDMESLVGSAATQKIILEECLTGREVSLLAFVDGEHFVLMPPVRDHKRIGDGDTGPNTGGMGTITDPSLLSQEQTQSIIDTIIRPTLHGCIRDGFPFRGVLFLGLMITAAGPKVLEYNVRFGDPEAQAILVRLKTDLVDICEAMLAGRLSELDIQWQPGSSACIILASEGYPGKPRTGDVIAGLDKASAHEGVTIFHSGTAFQSGKRRTVNDESSISSPPLATHHSPFITAGGRVLGVTATGGDLSSSLDRAYRAVSEISWPGMQYRRDIGKSGSVGAS